MVRNEIKNIIKKAIENEQWDFNAVLKNTAIEVEILENKEFGDYSSNIALKIAKFLKKNPMETAINIKNQISKIKNVIFDKIEIINPGFINFFLSRNYLCEKIFQIVAEAENFGKINYGKGKFIQIEFISANPTGPLTLGNARGGFFGDILANIMEFAGFKIEKEYFINNAKTSHQIEELGKTFLGKSENYLTPKLKLLIKKLSRNKKIKISGDAGEMGNILASKIQKENQKFIENKLKIKFDNWFSEQWFFENKQIDKIKNALENNSFVYKKDGALWLQTTKLNDNEDRVIVRSDGKPTYLLSDIAYHIDKYRRGYDKVIDIWGADHHGHINPLKSALKILGVPNILWVNTQSSWLDIIITQMVRVKEKGETKKMSKRAGVYITLEELIKKVGLDAARFFFAMRSPDTHLDFDIQIAQEKSVKNPLYYIQYTSARINGILVKIRDKGQGTRDKTKLKLLIHPDELNLIKQLIRFPEIIEDISKDCQIHRLPNYLLELSSSFHKFYENCRIIKADKKIAEARLTLLGAAKIVLENGLKLMGIAAPKRM